MSAKQWRRTLMRKKSKLWYAAHAVLYFEFKNRRPQRKFVVFENIYLVHAKTAAEARKKAEAHARFEASVEDNTRVNDIPAKMVFAGIRKVVSCAGDPQTPNPDTVASVYDGIEASYSRFIVTGRERLNALVRGESIPVVYEE